MYPSIILGFYLWSRSFEILAAFIIDAIDKTKPRKPSSSKLEPRDRISLSLKSYIELILIFALGYWLMPGCWWESAPKSILESVYFSGVTITTLGYGDIHPTHIIPQLLTVYEVLCGFSLIVVSFAIYTGLDSVEKE
jgi:voltage-gated potassium channel